MGPGGPRSGAKASKSRPRLRAKADQARGVRVKAGQDRGSRRATVGGLRGQQWRAKADRDHSEIKKRGIV